jgi:hypothetical protein
VSDVLARDLHTGDTIHRANWDEHVRRVDADARGVAVVTDEFPTVLQHFAVDKVLDVQAAAVMPRPTSAAEYKAMFGHEPPANRMELQGEFGPGPVSAYSACCLDKDRGRYPASNVLVTLLTKPYECTVVGIEFACATCGTTQHVDLTKAPS